MSNSCNLCTLLTGQSVDKIIIIDECDKKAHTQLHFLQSMFINRDETTLEQVFGQCFGEIKVQNRTQNGDALAKSRFAILKYCKDVFSKRSNSGSGPVSCHQCSAQLLLYENNRVRRWRTIIDHAISHLEDPLFICRRCDYKSYTKRSIGKHIRRLHGAQSNDYDDLSSTYEEKIKESIKNCFQGGATNLETTATEKMIALHHKKRILSHIRVCGSELKIQRHFHGNRLCKAAVRQNGKIFCQICSKQIIASGRPNVALLHAELHLKKQLYQCKMCPERFSTYSRMRLHVNHDHKISPAGCYVDLSDKFHAEIIQVMDKCFG